MEGLFIHFALGGLLMPFLGLRNGFYTNDVSLGAATSISARADPCLLPDQRFTWSPPSELLHVLEEGSPTLVCLSRRCSEGSCLSAGEGSAQVLWIDQAPSEIPPGRYPHPPNLRPPAPSSPGNALGGHLLPLKYQSKDPQDQQLC